MNRYTKEEQMQDPLGTLQLIGVEMAGGMGAIKKEMQMPTDNAWKEKVAGMSVFRHEDPSQHYEPMHKMGSGGFAQVFKVRRTRDDAHFALKLMEPRNQKERDMMLNECALMQANKGETIINCIEAFIFKDRYWIILELMEGALTDVLLALNTNYSEGFCKYVLLKTL